MMCSSSFMTECRVYSHLCRSAITEGSCGSSSSASFMRWAPRVRNTCCSTTRVNRPVNCSASASSMCTCRSSGIHCGSSRQSPNRKVKTPGSTSDSRALHAFVTASVNMMAASTSLACRVLTWPQRWGACSSSSSTSRAAWSSVMVWWSGNFGRVVSFPCTSLNANRKAQTPPQPLSTYPSEVLSASGSIACNAMMSSNPGSAEILPTCLDSGLR
mmetsp:Transcript_61743/g.102016  ORF Transcript_61743/g.102016 Transcript_61743/m.102016 type:complete len:215 (-) Transcript_61743:129-773(-)